MNQWKKRFGTVLFLTTTQIAFWILYTQTGNLLGSIGMTACISISLLGVLYWLGKVDQRKQAS